MYQTILVPLDGSNEAEIAIPYAEEVSAKLGAEITMASVSGLSAPDIDHLYRAYLERVKEQVRHQLKDYGAKKEAKVFTKILLGKPADELLHYADEINVDLIVMASCGSSGKGLWLLGNIAAKVLRATNRPLLLIRISASDAALQQKRLVKRILVPLDGSKIGEAAIPCTKALAQALGAELVLFRVVRQIVPSKSGTVAGLEQEQEGTKASAIAYLEKVGKPLKKRGLRLSTSVEWSFKSPAEHIIEYAEENAIDLIAMSTHGRSGIGRWVFGSETDKVLHTGDTPVLVVRATKVR